MDYLLIFLGAGLGGALRHGMNSFAIWLGGMADLPYGTFAINVLGSFLMGVVAGHLSLGGSAVPRWSLFAMSGVLGGFTTFSGFSLEAVLLYERGRLGAAFVYVLSSVVISIAALLAGMQLAVLLPHFRIR